MAFDGGAGCHPRPDTALRVDYKASVGRDLRRLDKPTARRILGKIERDLAAPPAAGVPLTGEFKGLFRYRVGDWRVIYARTLEGVLILRIAHRREAYR